MRYRSNQRITKIKLDKIKQLLEQAESIDVKDATIIQEAGNDLTPYPDMNKLRLWTRSYLTSGLTKLYPVSVGGNPSSSEVLKPWTQPALTSNNFYDSTLNGTIQLVASSEYSSSYAAWKCMNGQNKDNITDNSWATTGTSTSGWLTVTFPTTMKIKGLNILGRDTTSIKIIDNNTNKIITTLDNTEYELNTSWTTVEFLVYTNSIKFEVAGTATVGISDLVFNADMLVENNPENPETVMDGDTYYTVLIDGLPIYTKLTKSLEPNVISNDSEWTQPALTSNGTIGGDDYAALASTTESSHEAYKAFDNNSSTTWGPSSPSMPQWLTYYSPIPLKLTRVNLNFSTDTREIYSAGYVEASNDNTTWTKVGEFTDNNNLSFTLNLTTSDFYKYYRYTFTAHAGDYWGKVQMQQYGTTGSLSKVPVTTSKPGLWLSNLSSPVSYSVAGSWIRQNLINTDSSAFDNVNNDTIGNYAYSFFQRGVIHRDAGSQHDGNDSFCMHWSPSALGCISHDAIVIPGNELQNTYTSYQTLVVPANPDMQSYQEIAVKDVQFTFVDNNDNIPLSTTTFNGRLVGKDWSYEFRVRPNFSGSGTNYGGQTRCCPDDDATCTSNLNCSGADATCPECISDDTRSNGVVVEGNIVTNDGCNVYYTLNVLSTQAILNADFQEHIKEHIDATGVYLNMITQNFIDEWLNYSSTNFAVRSGYSGICTSMGDASCSHLNRAIIGFWSRIGVSNIPSLHERKYVLKQSSYFNHTIAFLRMDDTGIIDRTTGSLTHEELVKQDWYVGDFACDYYTYNSSTNLCEYHGEGTREMTYWSNRIPNSMSPTILVYGEPTGIDFTDIILVIDDLKEQARVLGLPWDGDCNSRFNVFITISSNYESKPGRSFRTLYRGVRIDELGNISGLGLDTLTVKG